ncbi:MAG TPA: serine hydrolase domain-containing protein [Myxococcota bacterium]|nr:serine hydrolase domain-containing protein [Myxococcota bacterium]
MKNVHGAWARGFEWVGEAFAKNLAEGEVGAACCVYWNGECVVDVWGGLADRDAGRPWQRDTAALVFSSTKGVTAALIHLLAQRDQLELDAPVARYWPEFAANGKQWITVRHVLAHRAGLPAVEGALTLDDVYAWHPVCAAIAAQKPEWEPGTAHGYHARTFGWILGELVRRVTGATVGQLLAKEAAEPLGLELWIGLPEDIEPRVATNYTAPEPAEPEQRALRAKFMGPDTLLGRALEGPSGVLPYGPIWNTRALHAAELPSSNGIATARGLARFYASLIGDVDGVHRLLSEPIVAAAAAPQVEGPDKVILVPTRFASGFALPPMLSLDAPDTAFGHPGAGGSLGFADPASGLAFGYVMNQMQLGIAGDPRAERLLSAAYASLTARK